LNDEFFQRALMVRNAFAAVKHLLQGAAVTHGTRPGTVRAVRVRIFACPI
jgi:hypothetical protein